MSGSRDESPKRSELVMSLSYSAMSSDKNNDVRSIVTKGEGNEAGGMEEGSLSSFIVPIESREIQVRGKPASREGKNRITEPLMRNTNTHGG